jgi:hypothetical protein
VTDVVAVRRQCDTILLTLARDMLNRIGACRRLIPSETPVAFPDRIQAVHLKTLLHSSKKGE